MTDIPYLTHLREDLVTGIGQRQRRIARRRRAVIVLAPLVLAATVVGATLPGGSSRAFAIEQDGDWIEVRIADAAASEAQMEHELQAAGIDADIILAPTTAEYVGRWTCIGAYTRIRTDAMRGDPPRPPESDSYLRVTPEVLYVKRAFTGGFTDRLELVIGRAPEAGEQAMDWPEVCGDGIRVVSEQ
jgi:hypothetical protein